MLALLLVALFACASAFTAMPARAFGVVRASSAVRLSMTAAPPGYKPSFDGTFRKAGEHPETFTLEHENGARAIVDTVTATAISWKTAAGKELIKDKKSAHWINGAALKGHFVPEERAKKMTFDRMIFKVSPEDFPDLEYRVDVTMRDAVLEYDVIIINKGASAPSVKIGLTPNHDTGASKITQKKGYTADIGEAGVETGTWAVPVGKFKETAFFVKVEPK